VQARAVDCTVLRTSPRHVRLPQTTYDCPVRRGRAMQDVSTTYVRQAADHLISTAASHPSLDEVRKAYGLVDLEQRLRIVADLTLPLTLRASAAWFSSGVKGLYGPSLGGGSLTKLALVLSRLGGGEELLSATKAAAKRTREPITVMVPLIWLEAQRDQKAKICNESIPDSPVLDGIPMYAFDKHTRLGQGAIQNLIRESAPLRACLEQLVPKQSWRKATQMAAFYTDGYPISRRLDWSLSRSLEDLGIESDFCRVGVPSEGIASLRKVMRDDLSLLNEIRWKLWEGRNLL